MTRRDFWKQFQQEVRANGACLVLGHNWCGVKFKQPEKTGDELKTLVWECLRCKAKSL